jgi:type I restriction enzyme R subunit
LKQATDDAIALFGDREAGGIVLLKSYNDYYFGYDDNGKHKAGYKDLVEIMLSQYPVGDPITGENAKKDFIKLFGSILRARNILSAFDEFAGNEILSLRDMQNYQSVYLDLHQEFTREKGAGKANINDDIVFELELVKQIEVNIDYILMLVAKYHVSNCKDKEILAAIDKAIGSSQELRSKRELIENFIAQINAGSNIDKDWQAFVLKQKEQDLSEIIATEKLKPDEARRFIEGAFRDGVMKTSGTDLDKILPPISRFAEDGGRAEKKQRIIEKLLQFFERFWGLVNFGE